MTTDQPTHPTVYELPLLARGEPGTSTARGGLSEPLLVHNVLWFCRFRWIVIAVLAGFGLLGLSPAALRAFGLRPPGAWPMIAAGVLAVANVLFLIRARGRKGALVNLWSQIILDLLVLTAVVHYFGSVETYAAFTFLFHIVLACVFFSRLHSLLVTVLATGLYVGCLAAEHLGILAPAGVLAGVDLRTAGDPFTRAEALNGLSAVAIWLVVWYLVAHLSIMVRQRDSRLAETNRRLVGAQEERTRHMLTTTHQLKAPFAAIHANAQLLLKGHCGELSPEAITTAEKISARCRRLAGEIQDMLQLANLGSASQHPQAWIDVDLAATLEWTLAHVQPTVRENEIVLEEDIQPARTRGVEDHLKMLFSNLLTNAVAYSHRGGHVRVTCRCDRRGRAIVTVADEGIGIPADKLPLIFGEHYRTNEAVKHNRESSGLGLAIVRQVAERHRIRLHVTSQPGEGTTFELRFPPTEVLAGPLAAKERDDGLPSDRG